MMNLQRNLSLYLEAHGWSTPRQEGRVGRLWDHADTGLSVAVPSQVEEGTLDWRSITERLAEVERISVAEVEADVKLLSTDVANIRAANDLVISNTIPFEAGLTMVQSAWAMFRSCATASMRVRPRIQGNYSRRADEIAARARMAHTKQGSYIIPLLLPLTERLEVDDVMIQGATPEPPERRVMRTFAEAMAKIEAVVVQPEREPRGDDLLELVFAGITAEFASALHQVLVQDSVAEFGTTFQWAPIAGKEPEGLHSFSIPAQAAVRVEAVAERLRKRGPKFETEALTGPIIAARRDPEQGGVVTIDTVRNARNAHVNVRISNDERFDEAVEWLKRRTTVVVEGRIAHEAGGLFSDRRDGIEPLTARQLPQS